MSKAPNSSSGSCNEEYGGALASRPPGSTYENLYDHETVKEHHEENKENERGRRTLLEITVEIEDGRTGYIEMKEGDSSEGVAAKFCHDYSIPEQFVTPLTEHILFNIINISKQDRNMVFCSTKERDAYESRLRQQTTSHKYQDENRAPDCTTAARECGCQYRDSHRASLLAQFQNVNKPPSGWVAILSNRTARNKPRKMLAQRLLCPTHSSRLKALKVEHNKKGGKRNSSNKAKVGCLRLYAESMKCKLKLEECRRRDLELYQEKFERTKIRSPKKSWRMMRMRSEIAKRYRNYGELLYTEGLALKEKQMKKSEKIHKEDEAKEMKDFTGIPEISERAKQLRRKQGNVWDMLATGDKRICEELRNEVMEAQMAECTFKPRINSYTLKPDDGSTSRFEQLFLDAESRNCRQKEYSNWYPEGLTFQPAINRRRNDDMEDNQESVFDRLLQNAAKLQEKKASQQSNSETPTDKTTGRELFKPLTGRRPQTARNPKSLPIGDFLHELKNAHNSRKQALLEREQKIQKDQAKCHYVTSTSQKLLERLRQRGFKQLFDALDTDKDGFVELSTADVRRVSRDAAQDIDTIIKMDAGKGRLSFSQFQNLMHEVEEKHHKGTPVRCTLRHVGHADNNNLTFQSKISNFSSNLACRRRKYSTSRQWYNIILQDVDKRQQRVEALRRERQKIEMAECTFEPEFFTKGSKSKSCSRKFAPHPNQSLSSYSSRKGRPGDPWLFPQGRSV